MGQIAPKDESISSPNLDFARPWDSITLTRFLRQLPSGITVLHDAGDRPLRWVEPSDIDDPTPYLVDHELILTSGFPLLERINDAEAVHEFVARLVAANVSALGFGLDPYFSAVPPTLITACRELNLPLWQIPGTLPFAAIGLAFANLMEADSARMMRQNADANRLLMRCVSGENPEQEIITVLAQRATAAVQLLDAGGRLRYFATTAGQSALQGMELESLLMQAADPQGPKLVLSESAGQHHLAFPIRPTAPRGSRVPPLLGVLQLSFGHQPGSAEHNLMSTALGLLEVVARQRVLGSFAPTQLATALLLDGSESLDAEALELFNGSLAGSARRAPRVVLAIPRPDSAPHDPGHALTRFRSLLETKLVIHSEGRLTAITRTEPSREVINRIEAAGYWAAFSRPVDQLQHEGPGVSLAASLREMATEAHGLVPRLLDEGRSLSAESLPQSFAALLPQAASRQLAQSLLGNLLELPAKRQDLYLQVLRAWLDAHGSWDATATAIDMHRNSVRRHITAISEILGLDLARAEVRYELFLALRFLP
ncbi:PucR family transcriptional regulator [Paeniglutamicibacter terrestris]|uniref:PucR family transcriptional regulator n=1 Tax=Paeniglutamicibacter terrestris TaxID=2723403 RepID=A0ABX1FZR5_9MICC|nr:PucR family transcriptional regulator [Paeniglutamicibacter terrestris]ASN38336.1 PucR family transcriptional regulator [Arthrobacter sp. 7749]NKG19435.1 PucR family transcriptional regulator [Paeniglutamicibacter terrestris]